MEEDKEGFRERREGVTCRGRGIEETRGLEQRREKGLGVGRGGGRSWRSRKRRRRRRVKDIEGEV